MSSDQQSMVEYAPEGPVESLSDVDREASRVMRDHGWGLGAFVALFDEELNWILLTQLGDYCSHRYGGRPWTLPGGAVHDGERPSDAALRELYEETGTTAENGTLRPAGLFARPYFQTRSRSTPGELIILYAGIGIPGDRNLRSNPPETEAAEWHAFNMDLFLSVPATGTGDYLQPMPRHWSWWSGVGNRALENQMLPPLVWTYQRKEDMVLPPWDVQSDSDMQRENSRSLVEWRNAAM